MFSLAILIGIYSYLIFALGLLDLLYGEVILLLTIIFIIGSLWWFKEDIRKLKQDNEARYLKFNRFEFLILFLLIVQIVINLIGALGPELGFDALWYHLTLPKLYLENHGIKHIPGNLLYYSTMPKLTEMLYVSAQALGNEIFSKVIHFAFGLLSLAALYRLSRVFLDRSFSLVVLLVFYSNLVVGWQSITAYIDLSRTFFEIMTIWGLVIYLKTKEKKWLFESAFMIGLAISSKLLAIGSLIIITILLLFYGRSKSILKFFILSLIIPLPWFIFSYVNTNNPIFPFFTNIYPVKVSIDIFNPINFLTEVKNIFLNSSDPISPIYLMFLPLILVLNKNYFREYKVIIAYGFLSILVWYFTPRTGGGRFMMPYLPALSLIVVGSLKYLKDKYLQRTTLLLIIIISVISIIYRGAANSKYLSVILGFESKDHFLSRNLNFSFGDFYDTDEYLRNKIKSTDKVLVYGVHNLYYINFPFIHESFVKKGDMFNYVLTQDSKLPQRFKEWEMIYLNDKTNVKLFRLSGKKIVF